MKSHILMVIWILSGLLAGCAQGPASEFTLAPAVNTQQKGSTALPTTPQVDVPPETAAPAQVNPAKITSAEVEPSAEAIPDTGSMGLPCSGELTSPNMEGPYYMSGSPQRSSLIEEGMPGTPILITGRVFDQDCKPIPGASVDFWQADANGVYDNAGFRLRGHVITDQNGYYAMKTIAPGLYTSRPAHIHVKVFAPDGRELLTTQLYFPGSENSPDVQAAPDLLVVYQGMDDQGLQQVLFNFVVQVGP
jgi:protocatechuate 3,4-dioxygenase beta subunit